MGVPHAEAVSCEWRAVATVSAPRGSDVMPVLVGGTSSRLARLRVGKVGVLASWARAG